MASGARTERGYPQISFTRCPRLLSHYIVNCKVALCSSSTTMSARLLRVRRPSRRLSKANTTQPSPADSGYGSVDDNSPDASPTPRARLLPFLDGPGSWDDSDSSTDDTVTTSPSRDMPPLPSRRLRSSSAPSGCRKANGPHARYERNDEEAVGRLGHRGQRRPPDRFVPLRDPATPSAERYRTTKPLQALSTPERLLRDGSASIDPFMPRRGAMAGPSDAPAYSVAAPDPTRSAGLSTSLPLIALKANNCDSNKIQFLEACHITEDKRGKSAMAVCGL